MSHQGRVAVITGASRGIGAGLASAFSKAGIKLGLCARSIDEVTSEDRVARRVDVRDGDAMDAFAAAVVEHLGPIDLWINNAGVLAPIAPLRNVDSAEFNEHIAINVTGVFHGSRTYARHIREHARPGVLLNISSGAGRHGYSGWSAYCASKAAVDRMSECIALEEADAGLRVHAVAPGVIDTDMQAMIRSTSKEDFPMVDRFIEMKNKGDFSSLDHVAQKTLELAFAPSPPSEVLLDLRP